MYKKLIIVLVLVAGLMLGAVPVYASSSSLPPFPDPIEYLEKQGDINMDEYPYYAVYWYKNNGSFIYEFCFTQEKYVVKTSPSTAAYNFSYIVPSASYWVGDYGTYGGWKWDHTSRRKFLCYDTSSNSFTKCNSTSYLVFRHSSNRPDWDSVTDGGLLYSNYNIYHENGELVFRTAPMKGQTIIGILLTLQMLTKTMAEVLYLIPLVIGLVVFCLALRKGYHLLMSLFHRA